MRENRFEEILKGKKLYFQATFCGSNLGKRKGTHFSAQDFESLGYAFCDTLLDYCDPDSSKVRMLCLKILLFRKLNIKISFYWKHLNHQDLKMYFVIQVYSTCMIVYVNIVSRYIVEENL